MIYVILRYFFREANNKRNLKNYWQCMKLTMCHTLESLNRHKYIFVAFLPSSLTTAEGYIFFLYLRSLRNYVFTLKKNIKVCICESSTICLTTWDFNIQLKLMKTEAMFFLHCSVHAFISSSNLRKTVGTEMKVKSGICIFNDIERNYFS